MLAFFVTTVAGLVLEPVSAGAWALICVGAALVCKAMTFEEAFAASDSQVLWLIVLSFFMAKVGRFKWPGGTWGRGCMRFRRRTLGADSGSSSFGLLWLIVPSLFTAKVGLSGWLCRGWPSGPWGKEVAEVQQGEWWNARREAGHITRQRQVCV